MGQTKVATQAHKKADSPKPSLDVKVNEQSNFVVYPVQKKTFVVYHCKSTRKMPDP
jgi:hypothetical protein